MIDRVMMVGVVSDSDDRERVVRPAELGRVETRCVQGVPLVVYKITT